jgi:ribosome recycling factor
MVDIIQDFKNRLEPILASLKKELAVLRSNRPSPTLVEDIKVSYYNQLLTVKQLGSISAVPPREIDIHVWDKETLNSIIKAIETSGHGFSIQSEGNLVRIYLPELSEERRKELLKKAKQIAEEQRIEIRHCRDESNKQVQKKFDGREITEDQKFKLKEQIQKEVEWVNGEIEKILEAKVKEIEL